MATAEQALREQIRSTLQAFQAGKLADNARTLDIDIQEIEEKLRQLVDYGSMVNPFAADPATTILLIAAINRLKVLDPAVGSGAFPMGMLQKLVRVLSKLDPDNHIWKHEQRERLIGEEVNRIRQDMQVASQISDEEVREEAIAKLQERLQEVEDNFARNAMDYSRKLFLIENCIYGVDIQPIAVQIAKLRFFISLVIEQAIDDSKGSKNRGILPLPNLETKFVAANTLFALEGQLSLRSPEVIAKEEELKTIRQKHFTARTQRTKQKYREQDKQLREDICALLKGTGLEAATAETLAYWNPYDQNATASFFDPQWMFGIRENFDIVIGNPPYVRQEQIKELKPTLKAQYDCYTGVADLYVYFYERALQLLEPGGILTYISSNKYFRANYGEKLRNLLSQRTRIHTLIDFGDASVFTAIAYPSIIITQKDSPSSNTIDALNWNPDRPLVDFLDVIRTEPFELTQSYLGKEGWQLESPVVFNVLEKLRAAGTPLGEYVNGRFYRGILTGFNEAFVVDQATRDRLIAEHPSSAEVLKPFVRGRDVKRWRVDHQNLWVIFTRRGIKIKEYPAIYEYLKPFKERLTPGIPGGRKAGSYEWYEIQDNIAYWQEFERSKIIYPDIYAHQSFSIDTQGLFSGNTCYFIPTDEHWMCGLLNSSIIEWFYSNISNSVRGGYLRAFSDYMKQIPIPHASEQEKGAIAALVQKCLDAKGQGVAHCEAEIDDRVAHLYGLTPNDLKIIRGE
jgi:adenine-specific DNA-methyltransferase